MSTGLNNGTTLPEFNSNDLHVAVNSIQRTLFVERLHVDIAYPRDRIIPYDLDNLYPQKIKSIAQRSGTTISAINILSKFISGDGFTGMDIVVNREGDTLWDILTFIANQESMFGGYALHFNYNLLGEITEINPVNFEFVRWSKNLDKYVVNIAWERRGRRKAEEIEYNLFNPRTVLDEMQACGGIDNYNGQLYYWIPSSADYYAVCNWDQVLDDAQFEAEAKLYSLSSVQNDYSLAGIVAMPKALVDDKDIKDLKDELSNDKGAKNAGGTRVISSMPSENLGNWKWFTPISRNNIDNLHSNQIDRAKFNIYAAFNQPPILSGVSNDGMFNEASFADAFNYYNSVTETDRKNTERGLNEIISFSIWKNLGNIQIKPKTYVTRESKSNANV